MAIRFSHEDARPMGRATRGVKGITLTRDETVVGMVVADPDRTLLSICEQGYGKRTPFGPADVAAGEAAGEVLPEDQNLAVAEESLAEEVADDTADESTPGSNMKYRRQRRGGKGLRDIKTTARNGRVVDVLSVSDDDQVLMVTSRGKIQRVRAADISTIGRNTQGVRIIRLDEGDTLVSCAVIPGDVIDEATAKAAALAAAIPAPPVDGPAVPPALSEPSTDVEL
jgi:DNA gyrase subunit A